MKTKLLLCLLALVMLAGCTIPVVGNSPEEIKHRQQADEDQ